MKAEIKGGDACEEKSHRNSGREGWRAKQRRTEQREHIKRKKENP